MNPNEIYKQQDDACMRWRMDENVMLGFASLTPTYGTEVDLRFNYEEIVMKYFVLLASLLFSIQTNASELASIEDAKLLAKNVMALVGKGDSTKGLQLFKPYLIIPESEFNVMLNNLKMQQPMIDQRFGKTVGVENVSEKIVGNSFMRITYAQKFEKHAMRWNFYFYKPKNAWVLNTFNTDDKIQLLFTE